MGEVGEREEKGRGKEKEQRGKRDRGKGGRVRRGKERLEQAIFLNL